MNITRLKIKSNYPDAEVEFNDLLRLFTNTVTQRECKVEHSTNEDYNILCPVYVVEYSSHVDLKEAINQINEHRYIAFDLFEDITPNDFTISLESDNINESFGHLTEKNLLYIEEQINMLDHIASDVVNEQEDLKEKVDAIYSFMQKSGILYYRQMVEGLLDVMDKNGLVDKDKLKKQMFKEVH